MADDVPNTPSDSLLDQAAEAAAGIILDLVKGNKQLRPDLQEVADDYLLQGARLGKMTVVQQQAWMRRGLNRKQRRALQAQHQKEVSRG